MKNGKIFTGHLLGLALVGLAAGAQAADFKPRVELAERSIKEGLGRAEAPLLRRVPQAGRQRVIKSLAAQLAQKADDAVVVDPGVQAIENKDSTVLAGEGWWLEASADGSRVRYRNEAYLDAASERGVPVEKRPSQDDLETVARKFVDERLKGVVTLGAKEALVPLFTQYQLDGGGSTKEGAKRETELVTAATVVFGRTVNDIHVLGPGSKVAVLFSVDGRVAGFDYDWPEYEVARGASKVTPLDEVKARTSRLEGLDIDRRRSEVQRVECGYFDLGVRRRDAEAPVQAACAIHTVTRKIVDEKAYAEDKNSGHLVSARIHVIPAGETVYPDRKWPQAQRLLGLEPANPENPGGGPAPQRAVTRSPIGTLPVE